MRNRALLPALFVLAALSPAHADVVAVYGHNVDAVHVNVYRPLGLLTDETTAPEVSMFFGKLDVLADHPNNEAVPEQGGCVDIFHDRVIDAGCGSLAVTADGVMGTTRVTGTIETTAYNYDAERGFEEIGPSQIAVDLVVSGVGPVEVSRFSNYAVGVCGLPPDTRGVFVDGKPELQRNGAMTGTLVSQYAGAVDPTTLPSLLVKASNVAAGACV